MWPIGWKNDLWSTMSIVWHQNFKNEIQVNSKVFSIDSKEFDTHIRSRFAFVFVQMPCRLACYRSFRNQWQHKGIVKSLCLGGAPGQLHFCVCPRSAMPWMKTSLHFASCIRAMNLAHVRMLYSDVICISTTPRLLYSGRRLPSALR